MTFGGWVPCSRVSAAEIESAKSPKGGWTYAQFRAWGVPVPPPKGWKARLIAGPEGSAAGVGEEALVRMVTESEPAMTSGTPFGIDGQLDLDPAKLLRKVVSAVISSGQAHVLYEFPDVLAFFGARMPAQDDSSK